ncbi:hypothetical protein D915_009602 [Fasciola hepatica]|uniref:Uncharacterized protein n=1 Tax=Fasciola hepatica TaxID=6192 RepID=A0A4E0RD17_FASHE|nr:hypothetical protein D915_009602 [Fasciola hepatica]
MSSNGVSQNKLKLVKGSLEDQKTMEVVTRMGMSVTDFMTSLSCPNWNISSADVSRLFVWPKHTDLEIRNPSESVYQYESGDSSWALRFRALGCYKQSDDAIPVRNSTQMADPISVARGDSSNTHFKHGDRDRLKSLLRSRRSSRPELELPCEIITQAERHKLLEDLRLTDSEDDESSSVSVVNEDRCNGNINLDSEERSRPTEKVSSLLEKDRQANDVPTFHESLDVSTGCVKSRDSNTQKTFVSPLSIIAYEDIPDRSCPTPLTQDIQPGTPKRSSEWNTGSPRKLQSETDQLRVQNAAECRSTGKLTPDRPASECSLTEKQSPAVSLLRRVFRNMRDGQSGEMESSCILSTNSVPSVFDGPKILSLTNLESSAAVTEQLGNQKNADFVRRVLLESETVLATEKSLLVARLSPPSPGSYKCSNNLLLNKENLMTSPTNEDSCETSHRRIMRLKKKDVSVRQSSYKNNPAENFVICQYPTHSTQNVSSDLRSSPNPLGSSIKTFSIEETNGKCSFGSDQDNLCAGRIGSPASDEISETCNNDQTSACDRKNLSVTNKFRYSKCKYTDSDHENQSQEFHVKSITDSTTEVRAGWDTTASARDVNPSSDGASSGDQGHTSPLYQLCRTNEASVFPVNSNSGAEKHPGALDIAKKLTISTESSDHIGRNSPGVNGFWKGGSHPVDAHRILSEHLIKPVRRGTPEKRWVFSNIALRQVRSKLQSAADSSPMTKSGYVPCDDALDNIRALLLSVSSCQQSDFSNRDCNTHLRTLTGVLLVPPQMKDTKLANIHAVPQMRHIPSESQDAATMTSPMPSDKLPRGLNVEVQCSLSPTSYERPPMVCNVECQSSPMKCQQCETRPVQAHYLPSIANTGVTIDRISERIFNERQKLLESSVKVELASADKCKGNASRCWKSLVETVSNVQSDPQSPGSDRSHLLLTLDSLHIYPVYLIQGIRHYLAAVFLLHSRGKVARAVDLCVEVSTQLEHIDRRLKQVEAKLIKHCSRRQQTVSVSSESTAVGGPSSPFARAKRDAGWIHFWYYVLVRLRSIIHWHEYQFRMLLDSSLLSKMENELALLMPPNTSTENTHVYETNDLKSVNKSFSNDVTSPFSLSSKFGSTVLAGSRLERSASVTLTPIETESVSPAVSIRASAAHRIRRFIELSELMRQSSREWNESVKLASSIPCLLFYSPATSNSSELTDFTKVALSASIVDHIICHAAGGIHPSGQYTDILTLLCFIDGVVRIHTELLEHLRLQRSTSDAVSSKASCKQRHGLINAEQPVTSNFSDVPEVKFHERIGGMCDSSGEKPQSAISESVNAHDRIQPELRSNTDDQISNIADYPQPCFAAKKNTLRIVASGEKCKQAKRKRLLELDNPKLREDNILSSKMHTPASVHSVINERRSPNISHSVAKITSIPLEISATKPNTGQNPRTESVKPNQQSRPEESTQRKRHKLISRNSSDSRSSPLAPVPHGISGNDKMSLDHHTSPADSVSPSYVASTPSPPPIRRRSRSLVPACPTTHSSEQEDYLSAKKKKEATPGKRKVCADASHLSDSFEETTYKPKRIRPIGSETEQQTTEECNSFSLETSPFPFYQPSDPDEIDKARLRRCVSVGRGLSNTYRTSAVISNSPPEFVSYARHHEQLGGILMTHSEVNQTNPANRDSRNSRGNVAYTHPRTTYSMKIENQKYDTVPSYQDWINRTQSIHEGTCKKGRELPKQ